MGSAYRDAAALKAASPESASAAPKLLKAAPNLQVIQSAPALAKPARRSLKWKRLIDLSVAGTLLMLLTPLLAAVWLAVRPCRSW